MSIIISFYSSLSSFLLHLHPSAASFLVRAATCPLWVTIATRKECINIYIYTLLTDGMRLVLLLFKQLFYFPYKDTNSKILESCISLYMIKYNGLLMLKYLLL